MPSTETIDTQPADQAASRATKLRRKSRSSKVAKAQPRASPDRRNTFATSSNSILGVPNASHRCKANVAAAFAIWLIVAKAKHGGWGKATVVADIVGPAIAHTLRRFAWGTSAAEPLLAVFTALTADTSPDSEEGDNNSCDGVLHSLSDSHSVVVCARAGGLACAAKTGDVGLQSESSEISLTEIPRRFASATRAILAVG
mmetsp:Transcript_22288/g.50243  ORF Transcript_22288/g.50243 Transcript_22288/m.50243 type:complete len:200 (+) Transcript_22288:77-676(+)